MVSGACEEACSSSPYRYITGATAARRHIMLRALEVSARCRWRVRLRWLIDRPHDDASCWLKGLELDSNLRPFDAQVPRQYSAEIQVGAVRAGQSVVLSPTRIGGAAGANWSRAGISTSSARSPHRTGGPDRTRRAGRREGHSRYAAGLTAEAPDPPTFPRAPRTAARERPAETDKLIMLRT